MSQTLKKLNEEIKTKMAEILKSAEMKEFVEKTKAATDSGSFEVVISTADFDRQGESIDQNGWDLTHYKTNPVVLWGHDYWSLPIGIADEIEPRDGNLVAKGRFAPAEANSFAQQVRKLYDLKIVRATSQITNIRVNHGGTSSTNYRNQRASQGVAGLSEDQRADSSESDRGDKRGIRQAHDQKRSRAVANRKSFAELQIHNSTSASPMVSNRKIRSVRRIRDASAHDLSKKRESSRMAKRRRRKVYNQRGRKKILQIIKRNHGVCGIRPASGFEGKALHEKNPAKVDVGRKQTIRAIPQPYQSENRRPNKNFIKPWRSRQT